MSSTLWNDAAIRRTIDSLDAETRYKYAKVGERLYNGENCMYDAVTGAAGKEDVERIRLDAATQVRLLLRDGMSPSELTDDERSLLVSTFGAEAMKTEYGVESPPEEDAAATTAIVVG